jgi:hypothetical protein
MAKKKNPPRKPSSTISGLFTGVGSRRRRVLILPRYLAEDAESKVEQGKRQEHAFEVVKKWADLEVKGHLAKKETALDASFLLEVFGDALGYKPHTESPEKYNLERNFTVTGVGTADGALGTFTPDSLPAPVAVIELKGAETNLDTDKFNGRTPAQQCWDYLNALPECPWGIVSNFVTFRLYHRERTPLAYQEFRLQELRDIHKFRQFWCLFEYSGLLKSPLGQAPRAVQLLQKTTTRQHEVSDHLYETYSENRYR